VLGMKNSHFVNPNGLDAPDHYSTARDLAVLAAYAMDNPIFYKTVSAKNVKIGDRYLTNHNKLLWRIEGAEGVKTGYTKAAGRILVSSATRQGRRLIGVTINAPDDWNDHRRLLEEGFAAYQIQQIIKKGDLLGTVEIAGGQTEKAQLLAAEDFRYAMASGETVSIMLPGPGFVYAPVAEGAQAGYAHILINERDVGKVPVIFGQTVEQKEKEEQGFIGRLLRRE